MAGPNTKQVELKMTVTADASKASMAMQALTREAERAGFAMKSLTAGGPSAGTPGSSAGLLGRAAGAVSGAAGYLAGGAALVSTVAGVHKAFLDLDSGLLTVREKTLGFARALPIVGDALSGFIGNLMDARDRLLNPGQYRELQRMREESPIRMAQASARADVERRRSAFDREVAGAGYNLQSVREFPTLASGQALLTSSLGGVAGSFVNAGLGSVDPRLTEAMEAVQGARRGHRGVELAAGASQAEVDAARAKSDRALAEWRATKGGSIASLDAARGGGGGTRGDQAGQAAFNRFGFYSNPNSNYLQRFGNELGAMTIGSTARQIGRLMPSRVHGGNDPGSDQSVKLALAREKEAEHRVSLAQAELEAKMTTNKEKQLSLAMKANEIARAQTGVMKAQLAILDEQVAKARGGAQQFGAMSGSDQAGLLQIARRFKEGGRESVTEGELQMLGGNVLTRDLVAKRAEEDATNNPVYQAILKLTGQRDAQSLQAERDKLKAEVDMKIQFDEEALAKTLEATLKKMDFREMFIKILEVEMRKIQAGADRRRAGDTN